MTTLQEWLEPDNLANFIKMNFFIAGEGNWVEIFITNNETNSLLEINEQIKPYSVGLALGEIKGEEFHLSLGGAYEIAKHSTKKIIINSDAEQLFLYQRNVLCKSIIFCNENYYEKERLLVMNDKGDCLGIGRLLLPAKELMKKENANVEALQNLIDLGWYLRKGK